MTTRPLTSFIGREREVTALEELLTTQRVTTVLGPPGVGKSRLALEFAALRSAAWVCDVTDASSVDTLCAALSATLDIGQASEADVVVEAGRQLASLGRALVVLDNFEQLLPSGAETIASWVRMAPEIVFLVTSRQRLGLAGEALFDLEPLALPTGDDDPRQNPAVQLFVHRARSVCRDFARADRDIAVVAQIVRELDGLPLSIELCAARARVLSPQQILEHLHRRPTLSDAIESSWQSLSPVEQRALAQCSAFRGGFDAEAAAAVLDVPTDSVLGILEALLDKSLLSVSSVDSARRMSTYLSVRERAERALLDMGEASSTWERHGGYYASTAFARLLQLRRSGALEAPRLLSVELDNLLVAHARALESGHATTAMQAAVVAAALLCDRGPVGVALDMLERALATTGDDPEIRAHALLMRARVLRLMGRPESALLGWEGALDLAQDAALRAALRTELGASLVATGAPTEAKAALEAALGELGTAEAYGERARVYEFLGDAFFCEDDLDRAERYYTDGLRLYRRMGDAARALKALSCLAMTHMERGASETADQLLKEIAECKSGNRLIECLASGYQAVIQQERGELPVARARYERVVRDLSTFGYARNAAVFAGYLGTCLHELGQIDAARSSYEHALVLFGGPRSAGHDALVQACLGALQASVDRIEEARALFEAAEATLATFPEQRFYSAAAKLHRAHLDLALARAALRGGDSQAAASHRRAARQRMADAPDEMQSDVRFALRMLHAAFDAEPAMLLRSKATRRAPVVVASDGAWFQTPDGEIVEIRRRMPLRRIIVRLAEERRADPGRGVAASALIESAWPGENLTEDVAVNRLRVALSTLRKLGLASVLLTRPGAYLFDPELELELE